MIPRPVRSHRRSRLRLRLRHPVPFWIAALALTALTVSTVARVAEAAATERDRWGERVDVAVAVADLRPGQVLRAELRALPAAMVPGGALTSAPAGQLVTAFIASGEVVLERRLAPGGLSPVAALLPPGTRGIAVPPGVAPLPLVVGDRVDVLGTTQLAADALVVAVTDAAVTIAVDVDDALDVAYEAAAGSVTLVLSATSSPRRR